MTGGKLISEEWLIDQIFCGVTGSFLGPGRPVRWEGIKFSFFFPLFSWLRFSGGAGPGDLNPKPHIINSHTQPPNPCSWGEQRRLDSISLSMKRASRRSYISGTKKKKKKTGGRASISRGVESGSGANYSDKRSS